jgi:hypothetical protein
MGKATADVSDDALQRDEAKPGYGAGAAPHAGLKNSRPFVRGSNLPTVKFASFGAGALLVALFALRELPELSRWLHLPIAVFFLLLIGGAGVGLLVRRRWGRLIPREPRLDIEHMEARAARREGILLLEQSAFRLLPNLAAIGVMIWFFWVPHNFKVVYVAVGFALVWNVISKPIWQAFVLPLVRRT